MVKPTPSITDPSNPTSTNAARPTRRCGNSVVIVSSADSTSMPATTNDATTLSHRGFAQGPSTVASLHNSNRKTVALGSSTPANACTPTVATPSGAPGIKTIAAATAMHTANVPWKTGASRQRR